MKGSKKDPGLHKSVVHEGPASVNDGLRALDRDRHAPGMINPPAWKKQGMPRRPAAKEDIA
jgi:hypothetical protein